VESILELFSFFFPPAIGEAVMYRRKAGKLMELTILLANHVPNEDTPHIFLFEHLYSDRDVTLQQYDIALLCGALRRYMQRVVNLINYLFPNTDSLHSIHNDALGPDFPRIFVIEIKCGRVLYSEPSMIAFMICQPIAYSPVV
jgi:hypothetical protein